MTTLNPKQTGVALGLFAAIAHAVWAALVAIGVAGPLTSWILGLHFITEQYSVNAFSIGTAVLLVIVTFVFWFVLGWVFASVWNWTAKKVR